ncbi:MAG: S9 family peptidase [Proteobacteria bacterium]|nr:S9 family peptidase [Pseudomonadota bacterium]
MRTWLLALVWVCATGTCFATASHPLTPQDLFSLQWVSNPQIRPDGKVIAYLREANDIQSDEQLQSLWLLDIATRTDTQVGSERGTFSSVRWSPNGQRLAYIYSPVGGHARLFVRSMRTGKIVALTAEDESPHDIAWSPDGGSIAFIRFVPEAAAKLGDALVPPSGAHWAEPAKVLEGLNYQADEIGDLGKGYSHVFVVPSGGGSARQLTSGPFSDCGPLTWSADGQDLLLSGARSEDWERQPVDPGRHQPTHLTIYRLRVADGTLVPLTHLTGPYRAASFSPDGSHIAFLGFEDRRRSVHNIRLNLMDKDGSNVRVVSGKLDRSIAAYRWTADSRHFFVQYTDHGVTRIDRMSLDGRLKPVADHVVAGADIDLPYTSGEFSSAANDVVVYTGGATDRLPELFVVRRGKAEALTQVSQAALASVQLGQTRHLEVKSSFDGRPIDAWMITPPNFEPAKKYPLILEIHGGPYLNYGPQFSHGHQLWAAAGYVVVYSNPRGSTSYGEEFANLIHNDYPSHDYDDLMSVVDTAIQTGNVDANELFVAGHSGGGVLTAWIVGKTHRFRAAASQSPIINWSSGMLASDIAPYVTHYWFDKLPWEAPETYWAHSPLSLVGNVSTPTLVVVGSVDVRTPGTEARQLYQALQIRNVPSALIMIPGAYHSLTRPSQFAARSNAILAWFERYRLDRGNVGAHSAPASQ